MIILETDSDYNKGRGGDWFSPSDIKGIRNPKDFIAKRAKPWVQKDYFDLGTSFHKAILEPKRFYQEVTYFPEQNFPNQAVVNQDGQISIGGKGNKAVYTAFVDEKKGQIVLREKLWQDVYRMVQACYEHPGFDRMLDLQNGWAEHSYYARYVWSRNGEFDRIEPCSKDDKRDSKLVMLVRTKADFAHKERAYCMDLKSTADASPQGFAKQCANLEYDIQASMVNDLVSANTGDLYETFIVMAVAKEEPYHAVMYDIFFDDLQDAKRIYIRRLNSLRKSLNDKKFEGYTMYADNDYGLLSLKFPAWYKTTQMNSTF